MRTQLSIDKVRGPFVTNVEEISGQDLLDCNQCGKCSAGCPIVGVMDILPSQVIRMAQLGMEEVLESNTVWICASCLTCVTRCPKGVDLPRLMEALRQISLREGVSKLDLDALPPDLVKAVPQLAIVGGFRKYIK
ncbi:MAG: disulfide reductase [Chloroflexi bacterium]|nr:MAG: disulfide reductase [Anaerolineaceae bacterium 4572_32.2]RLC78357.1 MAG: disulfide reductase [Chloroflexota bacterium]RLC81701.1 MAG: disulfide reductase [Chloroflexota bacterium]HEY74148.1 4Fe-4S dicluster domain-containing protein [Thermoflexia bacterium]